ncbi:MAG TPA: N,N-dimethylformamidase beta subunit family domain-containing protein [Conexibacter sp.]|nr:N,N-dimethylformamidase beta subunit family domain-containing protein [Conexibacter sp.]
MTRLARIVFGLLVLATLGAFVVTQKLKSSPPLVVRPHLSAVFSPADDARVRRAKVSFWIVEGDDVSVSIVDEQGRIVRTLLDGYQLPERKRITRFWNGRTDEGAIAPDGDYRVRIALIHQGRTIELPRTIRLDTRPPRPRVTDVEPHVGDGPAFLPQRGVDAVTIHVRGTEGRRSRVLIYRTDVTPPRRVGQLTIPFHRSTATWDGTLGGRPAPPGTYLMGLLVADRSGNTGTFPRRLPPAGGPLLPASHAGVTVRRLAGAPPLTPVDAGRRAVVLVDARGEPYRWALRRLGDPAVLARGSGSEARLRVPVPRGQSGLHVLTIETDPGGDAGGGRRAERRRAGRGSSDRRADARGGPGDATIHRTAVPLVVRTIRPRSVLVVLPALTWQGLNRVDDDGDGMPNTLDSVPTRRATAKLSRPLAHGLPEGLEEQEGALLRFLDDELLRYDLTTDAALATGDGPPLGGHEGVVLAGEARWITPHLRDKLRRYVRDGGSIWSLGTDSLRRGVRLRGDGTLAAPTAPRATDALGGRPRQPLERVGGDESPVEITIYEDDPELGLFEGTSGAFAGYESYETLAGVAPGARLRSAAGAEAGIPVIAAWQLGDGTAIHTGLPQLAARAEQGDLDAAALVRRIWQLMARGPGG